MNSIFTFITISGIFGSKEEELDILPPPPPFPKIGSKTAEAKASEKAAKEDGKGGKKEEKARQKEELRKKGEEELESKKRLQLKEQKSKERKEKLLKFLYGTGLVKTEKEKKELQRKKEEGRKLWELEKGRKEQEHKKIEQERITRKNEKKRMIMLERLRVQQEKKGQKELQEKISKKEEKGQEEPKKRKLQEGAKKEAEKIDIIGIKPERRELSIKEQFAGLFPSISFAKKEKQMEISEELPLPKKKGKAQKPMALEAETPELMPLEAKEKKVTGKEHDFLLKESETELMPSVAKDEEEIQKAIESLRQPKGKSLLGRIFAKKEKMPKARMTESVESFESKVEMPHVMPRTYDKIDPIEIAEAKIHKARMALMEFNFEEAKRIYIEIMGLYNSMEPKEKQEVYEDIRDLYYERKSAERFTNK